MMRTTALPDETRADIQGLVSSGYGHLSHAAYLFLSLLDPAGAQAWLAHVVAAVTTAAPWPVANGRTLKPELALNVAFTAEGLTALGLPHESLCTFPPEFREG